MEMQRMNRKLRDKLILVATCLALCIPSFGQVLKGSISGTVADPQGAVVSGAQVKATQVETGSVLTTTSDGSGSFRFNLIPAGTYKLEVSAQGFKTSVSNNILVSAGRDSGMGTMKLTVGEASTTVDVTADAPLIETTQSQITNTFAGATLTTFAGVQENEGLDNLALFVPGVSSVRDQAFSNTNGGQGFSVNGLRGRNNDQQIDGQNNNDNSVGGPGLFVSDAEFVQQYVIVTNQFGPEYGRNAGSVVNIVTKSGGNAWHGSVYGDENNSVFNAMTNNQKNFFTDAAGNPLTHTPRLNDEFAGFTIGGSLIKNKVFFFGGFNQEVVSTSDPFHSDSLTPTPAGLATLAACATTPQQAAAVQALAKFGPFGTGGNPVPTNAHIPTAGQIGFISATCPVEMGGVTRILPDGSRAFNFPIRVDWQGSSNTVTARYLYNRSTFFDTDAFGTAASGYPVNVPALAQAQLISWTHNFSSRMVNEARVSFGRLNVDFGGNTIGNTVPTASQLDQAPTRVTFNSTSLLSFGPATNAPQQRIVNTWQAQDNFNYVLGKHTLKAGVNWTYQRTPNIFLPLINGSFRFADWSTFQANTPNRVQLGDGPSATGFKEYDTFLYVGDDWKVSPHLTLNLGATWTYYGSPANVFNEITVARESNPATAFWGSTEPTGGAAVGGPFLNPGAAIPLSARTNPTVPAQKKLLAPSIGFAYSPQWGGFLTGNGKTVIRGGYRFLYDPPYYNIFINVSSSAPEVFLNNLPSPGTKPLPATATGPNVRGAFSNFLQTGVFDPRTLSQTRVAPNFGADRVGSWTLGIERELSKNSAVEVRYVGNHGSGLFQTLNGNPRIDALKTDFPNLVPAGLTPCPATQAFAPIAVGRVNCNDGINATRTNSGISNYQGLQAEFRANNMFKQLTVRAGYTFSKTLDNVSEIFSTFGAGNTVTNAQNYANPLNGPGEYSFSGLDYPHTFSLLFSEQLPFFKEQHGVVGHLLGGWGISANYLLQSGQRYTPSQLFAGTIFAQLGLAPNYYDTAYNASFNSGIDNLRPFLGNLSAPATAVGIFAGDACNLFAATGSDPTCLAAPTQLISMTAIGQSCQALNGATPTCNAVNVTNKDVRFIINSQTAQSVFGTPFGNTPRNPVQDAITNVANASLFKRFKLSERASFEFHATALNLLNHPNFASVDPFLEDAGEFGQGSGFGDVRTTNDVPGAINIGASRKIVVGAKITF
jgi:hypothetical protein